ncbi:MAG: EAL domain-containing protein [Solirubrobacterales bacterium]
MTKRSKFSQFIDDIKDSGIEELASGILETLGFGVLIIEIDNREIVYANSRLLQMWGGSNENIIGSYCHGLICSSSEGKCFIIDGQLAENSEQMLIREDGTKLPIIKTAAQITINGKNYLVESVVDNSERKNMQDIIEKANDNLKLEINAHEKTKNKMQHIAFHDFLTGLPNRMLFIEKLNNAIMTADSMDKMLAIMFLDLDGFKMINDTMGHLAGDLLLGAVSNRLVEQLGEGVSIARVGGDEFIILIEDIINHDEVKFAADNILKCFNQHFKIQEQDFFITTSIGISTYPADGNDAEVLIKNADIAMYSAKGKGRNQYVFCTPVMKNNVAETTKLSNHLYRALEKGELEVYYQPQINCITNKIIGLEALLRWNHPELGLISPAKFIPIAEQTGLIMSIGEWVIRTACIQNKAWQDAGLQPVKVAVNLSVRQFQDQNIIKQVSNILEETKLDSKYLELEITESIAMKETGYVIEILNAFKEMGIDISIDDFGTEYSCLRYLKQLPVDRIKIAMPFIQGIDVSDKDEAIAKAIIVLAKSMKLRVIAEGVETKGQLSFLSGNMCDEVQGYYYYKPLPSNEIEKLLKQGH